MTDLLALQLADSTAGRVGQLLDWTGDAAIVGLPAGIGSASGYAGLARDRGVWIAGAAETPFLIDSTGAVASDGRGDTPVGQVAVVDEATLRVPEAIRALALAGVELLIVPIQSDRRQVSRLIRSFATARAVENAIGVLVVDGDGGGRPAGQSSGQTAFIGPDGSVVETTDGPGEAALPIVWEIDRVRQQRRGRSNPMLQLRPPLYVPSYQALGDGTQLLSDPAGVQPVIVACLQANIMVADTVADAGRVLAANLRRTEDLVAEAAIGGAEIVVFPEFWLQGFAWNRPIADWLRVSFAVPGPVTEQIGEICRTFGVYLAGAAFEIDDRWPGRWFTTAFVVDPAGDVTLRFRKLHSSNVLGQLADTSPGDMLTDYLAEEGTLFPVADSPYGRLAVAVSSDLAGPEIARCFMLSGAEIVLHAGGSPHTPGGAAAELTRQARAAENRLAIVSTNYGRLLQSVHPESMSRGRSAILDWNGTVLGRIDGQGEAYIRATIDMPRLRRDRLADRQWIDGARSHAALWNNRNICPVDQWRDRPLDSLDSLRGVLPEVSDRLVAEGVLR